MAEPLTAQLDSVVGSIRERLALCSITHICRCTGLAESNLFRLKNNSGNPTLDTLLRVSDYLDNGGVEV